MMFGIFLLQPVVHAQDVEDSEGLEVEQTQQQDREARRTARRQQLESLSDEQRQALRERRRIRESSGVGQRGQPRRRPGGAARAAEQPETEP